MITVLHRRGNGSEELFEAHSVERFANEGDEPHKLTGPIFANGVSRYGPGADGTIELEVSDPHGAVFIMNRQGSTIAKWLCPRLTSAL